jgi:hypothetical protein
MRSDSPPGRPTSARPIPVGVKWSQPGVSSPFASIAGKPCEKAMSFASRLATSFPKWGHIFRSADAAATPLPELRRVRC